MIPHQIPHQTDDYERRLLEHNAPWQLAGQTLCQWIAQRPELWDIDSKEAHEASVSVRDAVFKGAAPAAPGVYFLMNDDGGFLYAGKATYINNRIVHHFKAGKPFTRCWWLEMPRQAAELLEAYLIQYHSFPLNRVRSYSVFPDQVRQLEQEIDAYLSQCH
jgi:hypothetical protein